jgi:hypothetical protein
MTRAEELNKFLSRLMDERVETPHAHASVSENPPWLESFAWVSTNGNLEAKDVPANNDTFFVAVRNQSLDFAEVTFKCTGTRGILTFDKSDQGDVFVAELPAPPRRTYEYDVAPVLDSTSVRIKVPGLATEVVSVSLQTRVPSMALQEEATGYMTLHIEAE